jgi:hypothetical protein
MIDARWYLLFRYPVLRPIFRWIWFRPGVENPILDFEIAELQRGEDCVIAHAEGVVIGAYWARGFASPESAISRAFPDF